MRLQVIIKDNNKDDDFWLTDLSQLNTNDNFYLIKEKNQYYSLIYCNNSNFEWFIEVDVGIPGHYSFIIPNSRYGQRISDVQWKIMREAEFLSLLFSINSKSLNYILFKQNIKDFVEDMIDTYGK